MPPRHLYVHVPFCARRCAYCDFSIAVRSPVPSDAYVAAIRGELALRLDDSSSWEVDTLYFGGGTPSRLGGDGIQRLVDAVGERVTLAADAEVTLEVNPEDATPQAADAWRRAGVNRVSLGAQSFDDRALAWMRRTHSAEQVRSAVEVVRDAGVDNISLDLIFALPPEVGRDWDRDLDLALRLTPSHVSLYGLTVEHGTPLARWIERREVRERDEEGYEAEFLRAHAAMTAAGLDHYEVSNFGRPGRRSRHNCAYWSGSAYAGVGPAAHGFDGATRRWNVAPYEQWRRRVASGTDPIAGSEALTDENRAIERVYLGLRTSAGLRLSAGELPAARAWVEAGWASVEDGSRVVLRPTGWMRLDALAGSLTAGRSH